MPLSTLPTPTNMRKRKRTRTPSPSKTLKDLSTDEVWKTGDFTLISSDNVVFKCDSLKLQAASSFFRDGHDIAGGSNSTVRFTEPEETALVVRTFLELACNGSMEYRFSTQDWEAETHFLCKVVRFLQKYICDAALVQLFQRIELQMVSPHLRSDRLVPLTVFVVAAVADNKKLCDVAVKECKNSPYRDKLHPSHVPFEIWKLLPVRYMWSLSRSWASAYHYVPDGNNHPNDHAFSSAFEESKGEHLPGAPLTSD